MISGVSLSKDEDRKTQTESAEQEHSGRESPLNSILRKGQVDSVAEGGVSSLCDNGSSSDGSATAVTTTSSDGSGGGSLSQDGDTETQSQPTKLDSKEHSGSIQKVTTVTEPEGLLLQVCDDGSTIANMNTNGYGSVPKDGIKKTPSQPIGLNSAEYCVEESSSPIVTMRKRPVDTDLGAQNTLSLKQSETLAHKSEEQVTVLDSLICTTPAHSRSSSSISQPDVVPENQDLISRYKIYYIDEHCGGAGANARSCKLGVHAHDKILRT